MDMLRMQSFYQRAVLLFEFNSIALQDFYQKKSLAEQLAGGVTRRVRDGEIKGERVNS